MPHMEYNEDAKGTSPPQPKQSSIPLEDVIKAFREENNYLQQRIYTLERKVSRYDRAFEAMFKEELDSRVNGKDSYGNQSAPREDPFYRLEKQLAYERERGSVWRGSIGEGLG